MWEYGVDMLFPIPQRTTEDPAYYLYNKHETLQGGEKNADQLKTLGPKERHSDKFLGFSLCLMYWMLEKPTVRKFPWAQLKEKTKKLILASLTVREEAA